MTGEPRLGTDIGLDLALIGNCRTKALVDPKGCTVWWCLPRYDGDPVFSALLGDTNAESGFFDIPVERQVAAEQAYHENTAILITTLYSVCHSHWLAQTL